MVDPDISKYFSDLAKRRKNPYNPFKDPEKAREAALKSAEVRRAKKSKLKKRSQT